MPRTPRPRWFSYLICALITLHVAKALFFLAGGQAPLTLDSLEYWSMGRSVVAGNGFSLGHSVHRPPGYPSFLALHLFVFESVGHLAAVATQLGAVVCTALLTAWMCGRITGSRVAFALGLALPLAWMEAPYLALYLLADVLLVLLFTAHAAAVVLWMERPTLKRTAAIGLLLGLGILVKPVLQLAWIPVLVAMLYRIAGPESEQRRRDALRHAGLLLLTIGIVIGPWALRNRAVFGEAFLTKFAGRSLWYACFTPTGAGLNLPDTAEAKLIRAAAPGRERNPWTVFRGLVGDGFSGPESDDTMRTVALQAISHQPRLFATSVVQRWTKFWTTRKRHGYWKNNELLTGPTSNPIRNGFEVAAISDWHETTGDSLRLDGPIQFVPPLLALLGLIALARVRHHRPIALALFGLIVYLSVTISVAILPMARYRLPIDPLIVVSLVAGGTLALRREQ